MNRRHSPAPLVLPFARPAAVAPIDGRDVLITVAPSARPVEIRLSLEPGEGLPAFRLPDGRVAFASHRMIAPAAVLAGGTAR